VRAPGLKAAAVSSQVIQRDRHAQYLATLATLASTLDKIATEIRHLQRTEVREARNSSAKSRRFVAMPHKRNPSPANRSPDWRAWCGRTRRLDSRTSLLHERDIRTRRRARNYSRLDYARRLPAEQNGEPDRDHVRLSKRMMANLESTRGLVFSGQLLLDLVESGVSAKTLTAWCRATPCMRERRPRLSRAGAERSGDSRARAKAKIEHAFDLKRQLKNIDKIFMRVFPNKNAAKKNAAFQRIKLQRGSDRLDRAIEIGKDSCLSPCCRLISASTSCSGDIVSRMFFLPVDLFEHRGRRFFGKQIPHVGGNRGGLQARDSSIRTALNVFIWEKCSACVVARGVAGFGAGNDPANALLSPFVPG